MLSARAIDGAARGSAARREVNVRREITGPTGGVARIEGARRGVAALGAREGRVRARKVNDAACGGAAKNAGAAFIIAVVVVMDGRRSIGDGPFDARCRQ